MLFAALLLAQAVPAAQTTACKAKDAALPAALLGWTTPQDQIEPGKAALVDTVDAATLKDLPAGTKPGKAASIAFHVAAAGTYGIALDQPGWIDVTPGARGGTPLKSVAHGHGPDCASIRKIVRFELVPGDYRLAVTGLAQPKAKVMLIRD
ncbi:hypothetical protein AB2M62_00315 [Sphingomonas sp. MMS12-HWE2-04]|uniref:hypothetical protein n=1 Tax=Sphingomonas sp. MMS12-HWE2-04 TaxID=3234199 RepID=UPI00384F8989